MYTSYVFCAFGVGHEVHVGIRAIDFHVGVFGFALVFQFIFHLVYFLLFSLFLIVWHFLFG